MCRVRLEGAIKKGKIKRYSAAVKEEGGVNERGEGGRGRERGEGGRGGGGEKERD